MKNKRKSKVYFIIIMLIITVIIFIILNYFKLSINEFYIRNCIPTQVLEQMYGPGITQFQRKNKLNLSNDCKCDKCKHTRGSSNLIPLFLFF